MRDIGIYEFAQIHGIDLNSQEKSKLKTGDIVKLKSESAHMLYDGNGYYKGQYKELHQKDISGKITRLIEVKDHYLWGEYASVSWSNETKTESIHVGWLEKVKLNNET